MISLCLCAKLSEDNPTKTVKLTPRSSGRNPTRPICCDLTPMRPNRPHIPSFPIRLKERGHKTRSTPEPLAYLPSCLQNSCDGLRHRFQTVPAPLPLPVRFGEGAFTSVNQEPQAENDGSMTFSGDMPVYCSESCACTSVYVAPPASPKGSKVTRPPATVNAIPVLPSPAA
jgi:hypothetical protein